MRDFDVALAELRRRAFEQSDLVFAKLDLGFGSGFLQAQQPLMLGEQIVALPDPAHPGRRDRDAFEAQLLLDAGRAMAGMGQGMIEDGGLDFGSDTVGLRPLGAGQPVDQAFRAVGLEVAADFIELLAGIAHHLAGSRDVGKL
jgi:hypothetical protein